MLEMRPFGNTGLVVSPLTFGAWSIGGPAEMGGKQIGWTGVNDADSLDALRAAYDAGINLFDTADAYGRGHSEELLGRAFGGMRDKVLISSKAGMVDDSKGFKLDLSKQHLKQACEGSLRRLGTDSIDVFLLHLVIQQPLTSDTRRALEDLKAEGKIRHYGTSVQYPSQGRDQLESSFGNAMMIEYSPLDHHEPGEVMTRAKEAGVGVITRGALYKGLLTGKYQAGHRFDSQDVRSRLVREFTDPVLVGVQKLKQRAAEEGWTLLGMALNFQLAHPGCSTIAVGMKTRRQVEENVAALNERHDYHWHEIIETLQAIERPQ